MPVCRYARAAACPLTGTLPMSDFNLTWKNTVIALLPALLLLFLSLHVSLFDWLARIVGICFRVLLLYHSSGGRTDAWGAPQPRQPGVTGSVDGTPPPTA